MRRGRQPTALHTAIAGTGPDAEQNAEAKAKKHPQPKAAGYRW